MTIRSINRGPILPVLAFLLLSGCGHAPLDGKLRELDSVIRDREFYAAAFEARIDSLKRARTLDWNSAYELYGLYSRYQVDSSKFYLSLMERLSGDDFDHEVRTSLSKAEAFIASRNYNEATAIVSEIGWDTARMTDVQKALYYNTLLLLYATEAIDEGITDEVRTELIRKRYQARQKYISCPGADGFEKIRRPAIQMYEDGNIDEAIPILEQLVKDAPADKKAHASYSLAKAYEVAGNVKMEKYWFAQGAIYNLKVPSGEHLSLYELSIILFEEHDLRRALSYSQAALEEALACNYNTSIINSAGSQLSIVRAAEFKETRLKTIWTLVSLVLAALSAMLVTLWQKTLRQSRKIHDTADQIRKMNAMLEEAGKIKEGYVFRYINLSAKYLRLVEDYRHDLRVTLKEGGEAALREKLREPESQIQTLNHKQFYSIFDETFLGIFPNFVEEVNSLLNEQARFTLKEDGELPTGLRILAAIRLGITDSGKIAEFLNCAPRSVYTHRSKIKRAATCSPEEFEKRVSGV